MTQKSKFFCVAVEGATTDGRNIERAWIEQMARNFDPQKYGARVWLEHIRGIYPDSQFRAYGDVSAVKAEEIDLNGHKRLALFAQINPLPDLVTMTTKNKQKIYTSIEVNPKFADTGEAYLVGVGVTDSPASLGTDVLSFAAQNPKANPFAGRKQSPDNLFSEALEVELVFEEEADEDSGKFAQALARLRGTVERFSGRARRSDDQISELVEVVTELAEGTGELLSQFNTTARDFRTLQTNFASLEASHKRLQEKFDAIDGTEANTHRQRPVATGNGPALSLTDC